MRIVRNFNFFNEQSSPVRAVSTQPSTVIEAGAVLVAAGSGVVYFAVKSSLALVRVEREEFLKRQQSTNQVSLSPSNSQH